MAGLDPFVAEAFTYLSLSITIIALRLCIRVKQVGIRHLYADDYFMLLAVVPYVTEVVLAYLVGAKFGGLSNSGMTPAQRMALSPSSEEWASRLVSLSNDCSQS
jgi:hypothetical protein